MSERLKELADMNFAARRLRAEGKDVKGAVRATEEMMFSEAEANADAHFARKRFKGKKFPEAPWEKDWKEGEQILFDRKKK